MGSLFFWATAVVDMGGCFFPHAKRTTCAGPPGSGAFSMQNPPPEFDGQGISAYLATLWVPPKHSARATRGTWAMISASVRAAPINVSDTTNRHNLSVACPEASVYHHNDDDDEHEEGLRGQSHCCVGSMFSSGNWRASVP
jgi:hypothetical protein